MVRIKSLQQRLAIFMLLPVAVLLFSMGFAGFIYTRNHLLTMWGEATVLKLQRAAHHVDMRLSRPKELLKLFHSSAGMPHAAHIQALIIDQLGELPGVTNVDLTWSMKQTDNIIHRGLRHHVHQNESLSGGEMSKKFLMMPFHRGSIVSITAPHYDSPAKSETVSLISDLKDESDKTIGRLEVAIRFDFLVDTVAATGWWQDHRAFLVDNSGRILTSNLTGEGKKLSDNSNLERSTLYTMKSMPFGTVLGQGFPPSEVSGFYKLKEAPWTLVVVAPGSEILSPIIRFHLYYFIIGAGFIFLILILIRFVTGRTVSSIKEVSGAAHKVAGGDYNVLLPVKTKDEVGNLIHSFNTMVVQLKERVRLKDSLNLAKEVQQNLLPQKSMVFDSLDIAGKSIYCDETGGDYYDFIQFPELGHGRVGIAVGDVSGHGISAALLMTTARALIRSRAIHPGDLSQMITDVNRLLCDDTSQTGNFMTLFFMFFDAVKKEIHWVRAGHDPAILYDSANGEFTELSGEGISLGIDPEWSFKDYGYAGWTYGQVLLIGTDGIWEAENHMGERFGKDRLRQILRKNSHGSAEKILQAVTDALADFRQKAIQEDDITLVVVKAKL